jgi:hypothetical protein
MAHYPPIPGSRLFRAFCSRCRQPMRITAAMCNLIDQGDAQPHCNECDAGPPPSKAAVLTPRQRSSLGKTS